MMTWLVTKEASIRVEELGTKVEIGKVSDAANQ